MRRSHGYFITHSKNEDANIRTVLNKYSVYEFGPCYLYDRVAIYVYCDLCMLLRN
jgi:hypothetical protein